MRFLIHLIGDIHQPLHMAALVDERFPSGDKGGNAYLLKNTMPLQSYMLFGIMLSMNSIQHYTFHLLTQIGKSKVKLPQELWVLIQKAQLQTLGLLIQKSGLRNLSKLPKTLLMLVLESLLKRLFYQMHTSQKVFQLLKPESSPVDTDWQTC